MGCCASSNAKSAFSGQDHNAPTSTSAKGNRSPPPSNPLPEEETVKEVLSETPSLPKKPAVFRNDEPKRIVKPFFPTIPSFNSEEASEICSTHSGSVSAASCSTEKNDHDGQRSFRQRSFSGDPRRERVVGRSPGRRSDQSPGRVKTGAGNGARGSGANGQKRDSAAERSNRRSRSPAKLTDNGGAKTGMVRSGSGKRGGKSPGRVKSDRSNDKILKLEEFSGSNRRTGENSWPPTSSESLENPLVSLECFIFL